jgi:hypothetical protein
LFLGEFGAERAEVRRPLLSQQGRILAFVSLEKWKKLSLRRGKMVSCCKGISKSVLGSNYFALVFELLPRK